VNPAALAGAKASDEPPAAVTTIVSVSGGQLAEIVTLAVSVYPSGDTATLDTDMFGSGVPAGVKKLMLGVPPKFLPFSRNETTCPGVALLGPTATTTGACRETKTGTTLVALPLVTVISVVPFATAVIRPVLLTIAIEESADEYIVW
jgi:hypothetical protein